MRETAAAMLTSSLTARRSVREVSMKPKCRPALAFHAQQVGAAALVFPTTPRGPEGGGAQQQPQQQRKGGNGKPAQQDKPQERPPHEGAWT